MAGNAQKKPFARSIEAFVAQRAQRALDIEGQGLPAEVLSCTPQQIVTVNLLSDMSPWTVPPLTMPVATWQYFRPPIQPGDRGGVVPFDTLMGIVSGLGASAPQKVGIKPSNFGALIFLPSSSALWTPTDDQNACVLYGPNGAIIRDTAKNSVLTINTTTITINGKTEVLLQVNGTTIGTLTSTGLAVTGNISATGTIIAGEGSGDQVGLQTHEHPTAATGLPSPPTPGT